MIHAALPNFTAEAHLLVNGSGVGAYVRRLRADTPHVTALDIEHERLVRAALPGQVCAAGEHLPFPCASFDAALSNEVLEHVQDDAQAVREMVRTLRPGGRIIVFVPNRWYPFETHGIYLGQRYIFGNIPLVNYLPNPLRNRLAPHVRAYTGGQLRKLFHGLPVRIVRHTAIYGAYDNLIARFGPLGRLLRALLQGLEATPLKWFGLSHLLIVEKLTDA